MQMRTRKAIFSGLLTLVAILAIQGLVDRDLRFGEAAAGALAVGIGAFFLLPRPNQRPSA